MRRGVEYWERALAAKNISPNPFGASRVKVLEIDPGRLHIGPIEAIDGTPMIDMKPVVKSNDY
jgi:tRNA (Thr-GGU) A37 N-methylase